MRDPMNVRFNLDALMRKHHVTIAELARRMDITMKRVRQVRAQRFVHYLTYCEFAEAVTGVKVFSRWRYDAMCAQTRQLQEAAR